MRAMPLTPWPLGETNAATIRGSAWSISTISSTVQPMLSAASKSSWSRPLCVKRPSSIAFARLPVAVPLMLTACRSFLATA